MQGDGWKMKEREDKKPPLPPGWEAHQVHHGFLGSCDFDHTHYRTSMGEHTTSIMLTGELSGRGQ